MENQVYWVLELELQTGQENAFHSLMEEMVAATQANEANTLNYEWSTSADGKLCHIFERYADSAAAITHLETFGEKYAKRFLEVLKPIRFVVYGAPNQALKDVLAGLNPTYMQPVAGFSRH